MWNIFSRKIKSSISAFLLLLLVSSSVALTPITPKGETQEAEAFLGTGAFDLPNLIQNTGNAVSNAVVAGLQDSLFIKEFKLDAILNGIAKMILKSMTQSILTWINSGFQGSPAFVTDLKQFVLDRVDQEVGNFIYNNPDLQFLCSPFQLDVKIALATTYQEQRDGGLSNAQCTISEVTDNVEGFLNGAFNEGGWASWFEVTQNPVNTPTGAYLAAEGNLRARIADAKGNTVRELDWSKGFLSFKVCSEAQKASGNIQNCTITTPGSVIAEQINKSLGAGQDALIAADEVNEIIGALFAQIAKQAITGTNGLLGLGASSYSNNSFGTNQDRSFLDELQNEQPAFGNPFEDSVKAEEENVVLQNLIISIVNDAETILNVSKEANGNCITTSMPDDLRALIDDLRTQRGDAILQLTLSSSTIRTLNDLNTEFTTNPDPYGKLATMDTYNAMIANKEVKRPIDNRKLEVFIQNDLKKMVESFESKLIALENACEDRQN